MLALLLTWSMATARYGGPDEPAHVLRAAAAADGDLIGSPVSALAPGYRSVVVPAALATGDPSCFRHDKRLTATCATAGSDAVGTVHAASSAGTYPPWYYLIVGVPVRVFGDPSQVMSYRSAAAAWCAVVLVIALRRARLLRAPLIALASLSPAAWFLFGVVNPNALEIALCVLTWVGIAALLDAEAMNARDVLWCSVPISVAIAMRPVAVFALAAMTVALIVGRRWRGGPVLRPSRRVVVAAVAPLAVAAGSVVGWSLVSAFDTDDPRTASTSTVAHAFARSFSDTKVTLREMAGSLGWHEFSAPPVSQLLWWIVVVVAAITIWRTGVRARITWLAVAATVLATPIAFEVILVHKVGFIWQGRYSIPAALGLVVLAVRARPRLVGALVVASGLAEVLTLWATLRRYAVGVHGSWFFVHSRWQPPLPPFVLLGLNAALFAGAALVCRVPGSEPQVRDTVEAPSRIST